MGRYIGEENDPVRYSIIRDNDGLLFEFPGLTCRSFTEADNVVKDLFRAFFHKEPTISNQYGGYFSRHPKNNFFLVEFMVWNHTNNRRVSAADIRQTDTDAEAILANYYQEYEKLTNQPHDDLK